MKSIFKMKSYWYYVFMEIQKTALRLPKDLHQLVIAAAQNAGHSMNAEIIARLRSSFESSANPSESKVREIVQEELNKLNKLNK